MNKETLNSNQKIRDVIESLPELPSMPMVVSRALNIIDDPKANINELADIISTDISITTQILKLVNSAYYGFPSQITSVNKAMALLGFKKVKSLILSVAVKPMMMSRHGKALWHHSVRCAVGARYMSESLNYGDPEQIFIIGLLHDIGKMIMQLHNNDAYNEIQKLVSIGADVLNAEKTFYGFTHTEAGKIFIEKWNLPLVIRLAVEHHHNPLDSEDITSAGIIYIADKITKEQMKYPIFDSEIIDSFDYEIQDPEELREKIFELSQPLIETLS